MRNHTFELIACIWLVVVGVQFVGRYFLGAEVDLSWAYLAMLVFLLVLGALRVLHMFTQERVEEVIGEAEPQLARKQRRSRR